jgi:hypothetical protein
MFRGYRLLSSYTVRSGNGDEDRVTTFAASIIVRQQLFRGVFRVYAYELEVQRPRRDACRRPDENSNDNEP